METAIVAFAPAHLLEAHQAVIARLNVADGRAQGLAVQIAQTKDQITELTTSYNLACRNLASGKPADPQSVASQLDLTKMRLAGQEALFAEAQAEVAPIAAEAQAAWNRVRVEGETAQEAQLTADLINRERARDLAQEALDRAQADVNNGVNARDTFRRQRQLSKERRDRGQEL